MPSSEFPSGATPIYYLMVGEGNYFRPESSLCRITGFVDEAEFNDCLAASNIVVNVRYPVMGETSAVLLRALAFGKPCIVTDVGWFSELPDNVVLKLDASAPEMIEEHLYEALTMFLDFPRPFEKMGDAATSYIRKKHSPVVVASQYLDLMTAVDPPVSQNLMER